MAGQYAAILHDRPGYLGRGDIMLGVLQKVKTIFDPNQWELNKLQKYVEQINEFDPEISKLSDDELKDKTIYFKELLSQGKNLDDILAEAFAVVREAGKRTIGLRHYDVQMIGGVVLHQGRIAEMKTGEGKTLVATLPLYLNALEGKGAHLVTVNDYLAKRDARWMGPIYHFLGMSVGVIQHDTAYIYDPDYIVGDDSLDQLRLVNRRDAYSADITYGTNNEYGFDYLRDNMVMDINDRVQRNLNFAIVDEVDSILIDEARTPLIISGRGVKSSDNYKKFAKIVARLKNEEDYTIDEKAHSVPLTSTGVKKVEEMLGMPAPEDDPEAHPLYANENIELLHYLESALKAKELFKRDVDYVIKDGEIVIVDEFTGRLMFGRRYSDGIHQAIEAKENLKVRSEDQTLASITFQNYFRMYKKLAGMTGTAATEEKEFRQIYNVDVVIIPTNKTISRADLADRIYKSEEFKFKAVVNEIIECHNNGRPTLVGTRSIEKSEQLSAMLKRRGVKHNVLNAKHHEREAQIIAQAGEPAAVTIATNMAGRGVDIILGGALPSAEREKRKLHSAIAHHEKVSSEIEELKIKSEEMRKVITHLEEEHDSILKKLNEAKKNVLDNMTGAKEEAASIQINGTDINAKIQGAKAALADIDRAIAGHAEMLPKIKENVETAEEELKQKEAETIEQMKAWEERHKAVLDAGGLAIIGTERHESRRIDNQLRGRAGRQGDPGTTRFYCALEDELMRLFGSDRLPEWMMNWEEDENMPLEHGIFTKSIQKAQEKVESHHFDIRKHVLDYDNVMNEHRKVIYSERDKILNGEDLSEHIKGFVEEEISNVVSTYAPEGIPFEEWDINSLYKACKELFPLPVEAKATDLAMTRRDEIADKIIEWAMTSYAQKEEKYGHDLMRIVERWVLLKNVDEKWMDHLQTMDLLRDGIGLRAYGQKDPLVEYINESFAYFEEMKNSIREETIKDIFRIQVKTEGIAEHGSRQATVTREHRGDGAASAAANAARTGPKVGRNDSCPCGSGKKYKKCCGGK